ncbi:MAG: ABC transporter permease [Gemmatimonadetes bacterium]|nr:ABC transporter permease [Gemmatimonadota bacterium]
MSQEKERRSFRMTEHREDVERDVADEIRFHLEMRERELREQGHTQEEAKRRAGMLFGDAAAVLAKSVRVRRAASARRRWYGALDMLRWDVRLVLRGAARDPWFTLVAVSTLALGIGINVAVFGLVEAVLLRAPDVRDPGRIAAVYTTCRRGDPRCASSYPDYQDYRDRSTRFSGMAAYAPFAIGLEDGSAPAVAAAEFVTGNYFELLGVRAVAGRLIAQADDEAGGADALAVLSHRYARSRYGEASSAVGRTVRINGVVHTIVGVVQRGFDGLMLGHAPDVWLPMQALPVVFPEAVPSERFTQRDTRWIQGLVARLAEDATMDQARVELTGISQQLAGEDPGARGPRSVTVDPLLRRVVPGGAESAVTSFLGMLQFVVGLTLVLACANLANLLLARGSARRQETAVQMALGIGHARLMSRHLTECVLLALSGGALGLGIAAAAHRATGRFLVFGFDFDAARVALNGPVIGFALMLALATGLLFGAAPAVLALRHDASAVLREGRGSEPPLALRMRHALIALQLALCVVLLIGAGLFLRTLRHQLRVDLGFPVEGLALATLSPSLSGYSQPESRSLTRAVIDQVATLPGVDGVAAAARVPTAAGGMGTFVSVDGYTPAPDEEMRVEFNPVTPSYLRVLGLPIVRGRDLEDTDMAGDQRVIVIDETMARRWWAGRDPIGGVVHLGDREFTVVGIARATAWDGIQVGMTPFMYLPTGDAPMFGNGEWTLLVRTRGDARHLLTTLRGRLHEANSTLAITSLRTMRQNVDDVLAPQRVASSLLTGFGAFALLLASIGIWGVVGYSVARRGRELSIRAALGARRSDVIMLVARSMALPAAAGLAAGSAAAAILARNLDRFVFGITTTDTITYVTAVATVLIAAAGATLIPALRAASVAPVDATRPE